jgi:hypothetical protein
MPVGHRRALRPQQAAERPKGRRGECREAKPRGCVTPKACLRHDAPGI